MNALYTKVVDKLNSIYSQDVFICNILNLVFFSLKVLKQLIILFFYQVKYYLSKCPFFKIEKVKNIPHNHTSGQIFFDQIA
jgi:hypothetical protein